MAIRSLKTGQFSRSALVGNPVIMPGSYESIATVTGTGSSNTITFSAIPATFQHLQIRGIARSTDTSGGGGSVWMRFNSDTGSNYAWHRIYGDGSNVAAGGSASANRVELLTVAAQVATGAVGALNIDIHDYASTTKNKTTRSLSGLDNNIASTDYRIALTSGLWMNTNAITSITFLCVGGNFHSATSIALYGVN